MQRFDLEMRKASDIVKIRKLLFTKEIKLPNVNLDRVDELFEDGEVIYEKFLHDKKEISMQIYKEFNDMDENDLCDDVNEINFSLCNNKIFENEFVTAEYNGATENHAHFKEKILCEKENDERCENKVYSHQNDIKKNDYLKTAKISNHDQIKYFDDENGKENTVKSKISIFEKLGKKNDSNEITKKDDNTNNKITERNFITNHKDSKVNPEILGQNFYKELSNEKNPFVSNTENNLKENYQYSNQDLNYSNIDTSSKINNQEYNFSNINPLTTNNQEFDFKHYSYIKEVKLCKDFSSHLKNYSTRLSLNQSSNFFYSILHTENLLSIFNISTQKYLNFINTVIHYYNKNIYHNIYHAFDVLFTGYFLYKKICDSYERNNEFLLSLLLALLLHDIGHLGFSSPFLDKHCTFLKRYFDKRNRFDLDKTTFKDPDKIIEKNENLFNEIKDNKIVKDEKNNIEKGLDFKKKESNLKKNDSAKKDLNFKDDNSEKNLMNSNKDDLISLNEKMHSEIAKIILTSEYSLCDVKNTNILKIIDELILSTDLRLHDNYLKRMKLKKNRDIIIPNLKPELEIIDLIVIIKISDISNTSKSFDMCDEIGKLVFMEMEIELFMDKFYDKKQLKSQNEIYNKYENGNNNKNRKNELIYKNEINNKNEIGNKYENKNNMNFEKEKNYKNEINNIYDINNKNEFNAINNLNYDKETKVEENLSNKKNHKEKLKKASKKNCKNELINKKKEYCGNEENENEKLIGKYYYFSAGCDTKNFNIDSIEKYRKKSFENYVNSCCIYQKQCEFYDLFPLPFFEKVAYYYEDLRFIYANCKILYDKFDSLRKR
ncbi:hypothetical protein GVAV_001728 [Gurleya vavrai]